MLSGVAANSKIHQPQSTIESTDPDLRLLLSSAEPLFMSRNPSVWTLIYTRDKFSYSPQVVLAVSRAFYYTAPPSERTRIVLPLLRLLHTSLEVERVAVEELYLLARDNPVSIKRLHGNFGDHLSKDLLSSHHSRFYLRSTEPTSTKMAKLRILVHILRSANANAILQEFEVSFSAKGRAD